MIQGTYAWDPLVPVYLLCAFLTAGLGAGVMLFERFTPSSRRFFLITAVGAAWLVPLGLAVAGADDATATFWTRVAYVFIPFTVPSVYWMAVSLAPERRSRVNLILWALATGFAAFNLAGPWLVDALRQLTRGRTLAGGGWLGGVYLGFETAAIALTTRRLLGSRRGALSGADAQEKILMTGGALLGALTLLDYLLATDPWRAGWVSPLALVSGASCVTYSAIRFRLFAPGQSFATDEVLRTMADAVLVCDGVGRIRGSNPAAHALLGHSESRLLGQDVSDYIARPPASPRAQPVGWAPEVGAELSDLDLVLRPRSGGSIEVSVSTRPIYFGSRAVGAVVVARDVRDRIHSERQLQAAELRYRALFEHNPAIVFELDTRGSLVRLNPAGRRILGFDEATVARNPGYVEMIDAGDHAHAHAVVDDVLAGRSREYEVALHSRVDGRHSIRGLAVPVRDGDTVVGILSIALDVTAENRAKHELDIQRRYFIELFESAPEAIVLVGPRGEVRRVNGEFTRLFGYRREEALGRSLDALIVPDIGRSEASSLTAQALAGGVARAEVVRRRKEGGEVEVSLLAHRIQVPGQPAQMYAIFRDIGDRRDAERKLREREEELRHAQKLEAVGKLAGGIAHDFNNLVTVINGNARFALDELPAGHALQMDLEEIERAGIRAAGLTQQLLAFSRRQLLRPQVLELNAVVRELDSMLVRLIGEHIQLRTRIGATDDRVRVDRGQLEQVLMNLVVNARDAMPDGGILVVETAALDILPDDPHVESWELEPGRYVRLEVSDTGTGMDPATLECAFEPFFTTKERGKGTGLGLATVFGIVKQSGGHVVAASTPGEGSTFSVVLPLADDAIAATHEPLRPRVVSASREGCTILVVEDEDALRKLAVRVLERGGYHVLAAADGQAALDLLDHDDATIDLVLSDVIMPRMGGRELTVELARRFPHVPVVLMSGYDEEPFSDDAGLPGSDFIAKPFTPDALAARIDATLRRQPGPGGSFHRTADGNFDGGDGEEDPEEGPGDVRVVMQGGTKAFR